MLSFPLNARKRLSGRPVYAALLACAMLMYTPMSYAGDGNASGYSKLVTLP